MLSDALSRDVATALRRQVDELVQVEGAYLPEGGSRDPSSGPAGLPVIELGVTVKRGQT